jgi:Tetratricopeptide Repeats-Sensor
MLTCFVVQGFGKKTDFTDGRVLDLDASYAIIKDAVEAAGLECIRADEIAHSGTIDVPMYRQLLEADLVIADLSTYNVNAAFELGIRYGLRPRATIIVAEEQFKYPFDVGHIVIRRYKHLGEDIGVREAKRFGDELKQAIAEIMAKAETDSPVYTFLPDLKPPFHPPPAPPAKAAAPGRGPSAKSVLDGLDELTKSILHTQHVGVPEAVMLVPKSAKAMLEEALAQIKAGAFVDACPLLEEVHRQRPNDSFVVQQLALATYKSRQPSAEAALLAAKDILRDLAPATTNDPETLGLWGAIHKRLWEVRHDRADLDEAVDVCERGFRVKQDYYSGINLAHLLELRAVAELEGGERDEGMADAVLSQRVRRQVLGLAQLLLDKEMTAEERFWVVATLREAAVGLGDEAAAARWQAETQALEVPNWVRETSDIQVAAVRSARARIAQLAG